MLTPITKTMSKNLVTAAMGTTAERASHIMQSSRIRHLPITDELDDIVGMVSAHDLHRFGETKNLLVENLMTSPVVAVNARTSLRSATLTLLEKKISSVLVVDDHEYILGIVTTDDLLWHLAHLLKDENSQSPRPYVDYLQTMGQIAQRVSDLGI